MLYPTGVQIPFLAEFTTSNSGATGLTVTVAITRINTDGTTTTVVSSASATELADGVYYYLLSSASTGTAGYYVCRFTTTGTADLKKIAALEIVGAAWVQNQLQAALDSLVQHSGTAQAGATQSITLAAGAGGTDQLYKGAAIKVYGGTGAGQARVISAYNGTTKVATVGRAWATAPDSTSQYAVLALSVPLVDDNLYVTAAGVQGNVTGSVGSVTADVGITQAGADKVWASASRTLTSFGTLVADTATAVWGAAGRTLTAFGFTVGVDNASIAATVWDRATSVLTASGSVGAYLLGKLALISTAPATITSPITAGGLISLRAGDTYQSERGRALVQALDSSAPDLSAATVTLIFKCQGQAILTVPVVVGGSLSAYTLTAELASADTATLIGATTYEWRATWTDPDTDRVTLVAGLVFVAA